MTTMRDVVVLQARFIKGLAWPHGARSVPPKIRAEAEILADLIETIGAEGDHGHCDDPDHLLPSDLNFELGPKSARKYEAVRSLVD